MSVLEQIITNVKSEIQGLSLTDIEDERIFIQKKPSTRGFNSEYFPAILIAPVGNAKTDPTQGTNLRDEIIYPIGVFILDNDNQDQNINRNKYFTWYETILKKFRTPGLAGVDSVVNSYVTPGTIVDDSWFETGEYLAGMILGFISWETR